MGELTSKQPEIVEQYKRDVKVRHLKMYVMYRHIHIHMYIESAQLMMV